jgi:hypothetical protein
MDRYVSNNIYSLNLSPPFCTYTLTSLEVLIISTIRSSIRSKRDIYKYTDPDIV